MTHELALLGGQPAVTVPQPHEIWPPPASPHELVELNEQRQTDITISGNAGPIGLLERRFLEFLDREVANAIAYNSGTSALFAAYYGIGLSQGDQLIGPSLTYHAALSPAFMLGASVVLADVELDTRGISARTVEPLITDKTRAITVVHQWGHPADIDGLLALCEKYDLRLIEDCSHAHGSAYRGKPVGTFGHVAAFSLQANKAVFAGEGGMLVTNDQGIADRALLLGHYRDRARRDVVDPHLNRYWSTGVGLKLRMSPFNAIVALNSLTSFPTIKAGRHAALQHLNAGLGELTYLEPVALDPEMDMGAWYGFKPMLSLPALGGVTRETVVAALRAEGVDVSAPSGGVLADEPLYSADPARLAPGSGGRGSLPATTYPNARQIGQTALSLPTFYRWPSDRRVIDEYVEAFRKVGRQLPILRAWQESVRHQEPNGQ